ncbi:phage terminase large subunit (plasmid) [Acinetobacter baumannii]|nr:terminase large subunit [Acinetobacter phage Mithridates]
MSNIFAPCSPVQAKLLQSDATITVYGGSMGSAKTYGGLLRHLQYVNSPHYVGYVIRKNEVVLRAGGGAFEEAKALYKAFEPRVKITEKPMRFRFPSGAVINFAGAEDEKAMEKYRGLNLTGVMVDEGTQLSERQIWFLISRLRNGKDPNIMPNIWITCNPDPDSYLFEWVKWYLYPVGHPLAGRPDKDKNGLKRYFVSTPEGLVWSDNEQELLDKYPHLFTKGTRPLSFRFIGGTVYDNPPLLKNSPQYLQNLLQQKDRVVRERELYGNWFARREDSSYFNRSWCEIVDKPPERVRKRVRSWDLAFTLPTETNPNPDYTCGVRLSKDDEGTIYVEDMVLERVGSGQIIELIAKTGLEDAEMFGVVETTIPQDAGGMAKFAARDMASKLREHGVSPIVVPVGNKGKLVRFIPFSGAAQNKHVKIVRGDWNAAFFHQLEAFGSGNKAVHDDAVDAVADAYKRVAENRTIDYAIDLAVL